jgi:hypothetical protein
MKFSNKYIRHVPTQNKFKNETFEIILSYEHPKLDWRAFIDDSF